MNCMTVWSMVREQQCIVGSYRILLYLSNGLGYRLIG